MVINHNSGADEEEVNPLDGQKRWTRFRPKSGIFQRDFNHFHPSRYEPFMVEGEAYAAAFSHLGHRNPAASARAGPVCGRASHSRTWLRRLPVRFCQRLRRMDDQRAGKIPVREDGELRCPISVSDYGSGSENIDSWPRDCRIGSRDIPDLSRSTCPLRYGLKVCDTLIYDLRKLTDRRYRGDDAVTAARLLSSTTTPWATNAIANG